MSEEVKKISFGFSKLAKPKTAIISNIKNVKSDESVQFIDCVEDKSIKVINEGPKKPEFLVIPLPKQNVSGGKRRELLQKILNNTVESEKNDEQPETTPVNNVSTIADSTKVESLDEIAAREIIEDLKTRKDIEDDKQDFTVPLTSEKQIGSKEATLDDYESIPVDKFGFAMLRGMGWAPGKGIGKTEQVISAKQPLLRPKGLGLGADKVIKADEKPITSNEQLKLVKGSFVRIIAGMHKDLFGEVIGFDDETGRLIVKMTLGNNILTFNEFMVEVISKEDFNKNSKVINVRKYEEYKLKENSKGVIAKEFGDKQAIGDDHKSNQKVKLKSNRRSSSKSSLDSFEEKKVIRRQKTQNRHSSSPEQNKKGYSSKIKEIIKTKTSARSPVRYKHFREDMKKHRTCSSSPEQKNSHKYHSYYKESKSKKCRSSSEESLRASKHVSRKESKNRHSSSSSESSSERESYSKEKESKHRTRKRSSSSNSSSNEDRRKKHTSYSSTSRSDYKKKCKKNKEKKKSRKRSRSNSGERRRKVKPSKKYKKSKY